MSQTTAHRRPRLLSTLLLGASLWLCAPALQAQAQASTTRSAARQHARTASERAAARRARRCRRERAAGRSCGKSARFLRHSKHRRRAASKHAATREDVSAAPLQEASVATTPGPTPGGSGEACSYTELIPSSSNLAQVAEATLCLINEQREQHGELPLAENSKLIAAAAAHSEDMVARDYFEHTTPSGEQFQARILASGYVPHGAAYEIGENIDCATLSLSTPAATVTAWMNSPEHRANILNGEFRESGVGVAAAAPAYFAEGQAGATYTQDFGVLAS